MTGMRDEIISKFLAADLQVHPEVVLYLLESDDPDLIDGIIANVPPDAFVALPAHIPGFKVEGFEPPRPRIKSEEPLPETAEPAVPKKSETDGERFMPEGDVDVVYGLPALGNGGVDFNDFVFYFRDRYEKLARYLRKRGEAIPISALTQTDRYRQDDVSVIGMVSDLRNTANGHRMAVLEDPTDSINVLFNNKRDVFEEAEKLIPDEVVMVRGKLSSDGNLFFADTMMRPDIPLNNAPFKSRTPGKAVFISDVHVGSDTFLYDEWDRFSEWLHDCDAQYLLIAGDLVDGIGIYPDQDKELIIADIDRQYKEFGRMVSALPRDMQIIISPGNHDAIRGSEPQPPLPERFSKYFPENVVLVENPAFVRLQGVGILMYHGRSYDDLISMIPGASYTKPEDMMVEMLKRRHLACTYGMRTPILAAKEDNLIIDPVPEILHTGHVHICGVVNYRGVLCMNTGTWQSQTLFQKQMNIQPTPARAMVVDLQTLEPKIFDFMDKAE
ncbi:DNA-directed DNA polymerase II small subunit [Methanolacinia petrolearia]|uniref:DNA-directed DNA polymerase II small subunit n=1 Tax=Methanolacinia petrolearia TaxID=54120 RepID=UPI003BA8D3FB